MSPNLIKRAGLLCKQSQD